MADGYDEVPAISNCRNRPLDLYLEVCVEFNLEKTCSLFRGHSSHERMGSEIKKIYGCDCLDVNGKITGFVKFSFSPARRAADSLMHTITSLHLSFVGFVGYQDGDLLHLGAMWTKRHHVCRGKRFLSSPYF